MRGKSDKKVGGQKGHQGTTLKMVENPDVTIIHKPNFCKSCGNNLEFIQSEFVSRRQIVDIPPIKPEFTEHQILLIRQTEVLIALRPTLKMDLKKVF